jgi:hypothetical protein
MSKLVLCQTTNRGPGKITFELMGTVINFTFSEVEKSYSYYILEFRFEACFSDNPETRKIVSDLAYAKNLDCDLARESRS